MADPKKVFHGCFDKHFVFESYGVRIKVASNAEGLLTGARAVVRKALLDKVEFIEQPAFEPTLSFRFERRDDTISFFHDGEMVLQDKSAFNCFKLFNSLVRITVGEHAVARVFLHAGVVGWKGKAIMLPGKSFQGKSTLVAALVRRGAEYYSDEYAILDRNGLVHPFARDLSMRYRDGRPLRKEVAVESLGGVRGVVPLPVGLVAFAEYRRAAVWKPEIMSVGRGVIEMVQHTLPMRFNAEFSLKVLKSVASRAIIAKMFRGDAAAFSKRLLSFFDNGLN